MSAFYSAPHARRCFFVSALSALLVVGFVFAAAPAFAFFNIDTLPDGATTEIQRGSPFTVTAPGGAGFSGYVYSIVRVSDGEELVIKPSPSQTYTFTASDTCLLPEGEVVTILGERDVAPGVKDGGSLGRNLTVTPGPCGGATANIVLPGPYDPFPPEDSVNHVIIAGRPTALKAIFAGAQPGKTYFYRWFFGDGKSGPVQQVNRRGCLCGFHEYLAPPADLARVEVYEGGSAAAPGPLVGQGLVPLKYLAAAGTAERWAVAVEDALWWLHFKMDPSEQVSIDNKILNVSVGSMGNGEETASAAVAFLHHGYKTKAAGGDPDHPYTETVERLLSWLVCENRKATGLSASDLTKFDLNGNGFVLYLAGEGKTGKLISPGRESKQARGTAVALNALAHPGAKGWTSPAVLAAGIGSRKAEELAADYAEYLLAIQKKTGLAADVGGWNTDSTLADRAPTVEETGWVAIGLLRAVENLVIPAPSALISASYNSATSKLTVDASKFQPPVTSAAQIASYTFTLNPSGAVYTESSLLAPDGAFDGKHVFDSPSSSGRVLVETANADGQALTACAEWGTKAANAGSWGNSLGAFLKARQTSSLLEAKGSFWNASEVFNRRWFRWTAASLTPFWLTGEHISLGLAPPVVPPSGLANAIDWMSLNWQPQKKCFDINPHFDLVGPEADLQAMAFLTRGASTVGMRTFDGHIWNQEYAEWMIASQNTVLNTDSQGYEFPDFTCYGPQFDFGVWRDTSCDGEAFNCQACSDRAVTWVLQQEPPCNHPTAVANVPECLRVGGAFQIDGCASTANDPGDTIVSYRWTIDGVVLPETPNCTVSTSDAGPIGDALRTVASTPGLHEFKLEVLDECPGEWSEEPDVKQMEVKLLNLTIAPPSDQNPVKTQHTVRVCVTDPCDPFGPIPGAVVWIRVSGVHSLEGFVTTGANGCADWSYTGTELEEGTDTITAVVVNQQSPVGAEWSLPAVATKTWVCAPPTAVPVVPTCVTVGQYYALDGCASTANDPGDSIVSYRWTIKTPAGAVVKTLETAACKIDTNHPVHGPDLKELVAQQATYSVCLEVKDQCPGVWSPQVCKPMEVKLFILSLEPETDSNPVGDKHTLTACVTDPCKNVPAVGVNVRIEITGANPATPCGQTGQDGCFRYTYTGTAAGTDNAKAFVVDRCDPAPRKIWSNQDLARKDWYCIPVAVNETKDCFAINYQAIDLVGKNSLPGAPNDKIIEAEWWVYKWADIGDTCPDTGPVPGVTPVYHIKKAVADQSEIDQKTTPLPVGRYQTVLVVRSSLCGESKPDCAPTEVKLLHLTLTPPLDTNRIGDEHTFTACVTDPCTGQPVGGVNVRMEITGAHSHTPCGPTEPDGCFRFTYTGTAAGPDNAKAYVVSQCAPPALVWSNEATAIKNWGDCRPVAVNETKDCFAINYQAIDLVGRNSQTGAINDQIIEAEWWVYKWADIGGTCPDTVPVPGLTPVYHIKKPVANQSEIDQKTPPLPVGRYWTILVVRSSLCGESKPDCAPTEVKLLHLTLTPPQDINEIGDDHTFTACVTDPCTGQPVGGVNVRMEITGAHSHTPCGPTEPDGCFRFTYTGTAAGTDNAKAFVVDRCDPAPRKVWSNESTATKTWGCDPPIAVNSSTACLPIKTDATEQKRALELIGHDSYAPDAWDEIDYCWWWVYKKTDLPPGFNGDGSVCPPIAGKTPVWQYSGAVGNDADMDKVTSALPLGEHWTAIQVESSCGKSMECAWVLVESKLLELRLEPGYAVNEIGQEHVLKGCLTDPCTGKGVAGVKVTLTVTGTHPQGPLTFTTDANGCFEHRYVGTKLGSDLIEAVALSSAAQPIEISNKATAIKRWRDGDCQLWQASFGFANPPLYGCVGYLGPTDLSAIEAVPGVFEIGPGEGWKNFMLADDGQLQQVTLKKTAPEGIECSDVFFAHTVTQMNNDVRLVWPLLYEAPGTTFDIQVRYRTPSPIQLPGEPGPTNLHTSNFSYEVGVDIDHLIAAVKLFHTLPFGTSEVPLISDEELYQTLLAHLYNAKAEIEAGKLFEAMNAMIAFEMAVNGECIFTMPDRPDARGPFLGIAQTLQNPVCCKLILDSEYIIQQWVSP